MKSIVFVLSALLVSCASSKGKIKYKEIEDVKYSTKHERNIGDWYIPNTPGPHPVVITVHGGGWSGGDRGEMYMITKSLASNGFAVFNINYRLAPKYKHPAPIEDLEVAYKYVLSQADKHKLNTDKIALWGYSAGAHIVSYFALTNTKKNIQAVVAGGTPFDFTWYPLSPYIKKYLGNFRDKLPKEYVEASPITHLHKKAPPFFLYHAVKDRLVEHAQSAKFQFEAGKLGVEVERFDIFYWGHISAFLMSDDANEAGINYLKKKLM